MLTDRQRRFIREYPVDLNGAAAAVRAGYSPRSAKKSAWNNLGRPEIAAAIAERQATRLAAVEMRAEEVLGELAAIARGNILDHMRNSEHGTAIIDPAGIDRGKAAALCEVTVEPFAEGRGKARRKGRRIRIGMHDKIAALDRLARHYGLFRERVGQERVEAPLLSPQDRRQAVEAVLAFILDGQEKDGESRPREGSVDRTKAEPPSRKRCALSASPQGGGSRQRLRRPRATTSNAGGSTLSQRQSVFVAEYLVDLNGRQAAIRAGYSAKWAKEIAWQSLSRPAVAAAIAEAQAERLKAIEICAADVLHELSAIGRANILDYMRPGKDGVPEIDLSGLDRGRAAALRAVTVEEFAEGGEEKRACRRIRVKTHDKIAALDRLARHHGLYRERTREETPEGPGVPRHDARQVARAVLVLMREVSIAGT